MSERIAVLEAKLEILSAMVIRASREVPPPLRANILEELGALVPGSLDGLREDERPEVLRRRLSR